MISFLLASYAPNEQPTSTPPFDRRLRVRARNLHPQYGSLRRRGGCRERARVGQFARRRRARVCIRHTEGEDGFGRGQEDGRTIRARQEVDLRVGLPLVGLEDQRDLAVSLARLRLRGGCVLRRGSGWLKRRRVLSLADARRDVQERRGQDERVQQADEQKREDGAAQCRVAGEVGFRSFHRGPPLILTRT